MHVVHEPVDMQEVVGDVEPSVENEHIDEDVLSELPETELVFTPLPVSVIWGVLIKFPHPDSGVDDEGEERDQTHFDLLFDRGNSLDRLGDGVRPFQQGCIRRWVLPATR